MYPYQRTPMRNPYISPITRGYLWVLIPKNPQGECIGKDHGAVRFFVEVGTYRPLIRFLQRTG